MPRIESLKYRSPVSFFEREALTGLAPRLKNGDCPKRSESSSGDGTFEPWQK